MNDAEVIAHEVMEILEGDEIGLTASDIYAASRIANSLPEISGALNRLRNQGRICRGTDRRWRTMNQAERERAAPPKPAKAAAAIAAKRAEQPPEKEEKPMEPASKFKLNDEQRDKINRDAEALRERDRAALETVKRIAQPAPSKTDRPRPSGWLVEALRDELDASQVRLDRYVAELDDEVLVHLVEMALTASRALRAAEGRS